MPTVVEPIGSLERRFLDGVIRKNDQPKSFLKRLLFPASTNVELDTEYVQVDTITEGLQVAPFVKVNGQPISLDRGSQSSRVIMTPHIAVDLPLQAQKLLAQRMAGESGEYILSSDRTGERIRQRIDQMIADDIVRLENSIVNREEWMVAQLLTGTVAYTVDEDGYDSFSFSTNKPGANTIVPTIKWDNATTAVAARAVMDSFDAAKKVCSDNLGPQPTDCILGSDADAAFMNLVNIGAFKDFLDTNFRFDTGTNLTIAENWSMEGVIYRGMVKGIRVWAYNHALKNHKSDVSATPLIRVKHAEFLSSTGGIDERRFYYGAIMDTLAIREGLHITRRYTRTEQEDKYPSSMKQIMISRPLPVFRRPDWFVSIQTLA